MFASAWGPEYCGVDDGPPAIWLADDGRNRSGGVSTAVNAARGPGKVVHRPTGPVQTQSALTFAGWLLRRVQPKRGLPIEVICRRSGRAFVGVS